jgi:hypothetical protein
MSTRKMICLGAMAAMMSACTGQVEAPATAKQDTDPTLFAGISGTCPYPQYGCGVSNGTGVYYGEGGFAGMDNINFMVTHFVNNGSSVGFQGRYQGVNASNVPTWYFLPSPGQVTSADYFGYNYHVVSVTESGTYPTWTLQAWGGGTTFQVPAAYLQYLQPYLYTRIPNPPSASPYYLYVRLLFSPMQSDTGIGAYSETTVYKFNMQYQKLYTDNTPQSGYLQYCNDAAGNADPVVFQGGIDVAPTTGTVTSVANDVTLSCRQGAIATAYWWGYVPQTDPWHFAAAIHMKRGSYCGDENVFTVAGTKITILDDWFTQTQWPNGGIEALWTPTGASCFNQSRRPDGDINAYPWQQVAGTMLAVGLQPFDFYKVYWNYASTPYNKSCNGVPLPPCPTLGQLVLPDYTTTQTFLLDGVVWPQ